jgi:hypothetical protein
MLSLERPQEGRNAKSFRPVAQVGVFLVRGDVFSENFETNFRREQESAAHGIRFKRSSQSEVEPGTMGKWLEGMGK